MGIIPCIHLFFSKTFLSPLFRVFLQNPGTEKNHKTLPALQSKHPQDMIMKPNTQRNCKECWELFLSSHMISLVRLSLEIYAQFYILFPQRCLLLFIYVSSCLNIVNCPCQVPLISICLLL